MTDGDHTAATGYFAGFTLYADGLGDIIEDVDVRGRGKFYDERAASIAANEALKQHWCRCNEERWQAEADELERSPLRVLLHRVGASIESAS